MWLSASAARSAASSNAPRLDLRELVAPLHGFCADLNAGRKQVSACGRAMRAVAAAGRDVHRHVGAREAAAVAVRANGSPIALELAAWNRARAGEPVILHNRSRGARNVRPHTAAERARHGRAARGAGSIVLPIRVVIAAAGGVLLVLDSYGAQSGISSLEVAKPGIVKELTRGSMWRMISCGGGVVESVADHWGSY